MGSLSDVKTWCCRTRSMATASTVEFGQRHVSKGVSRLSEDVIEKAEGPWVKFRSGKVALDFTCGIGVTNLGTYYRTSTPRFGANGRLHHLGHCHPKVSKAAAEQCQNLVHGQVRCPSSSTALPSERGTRLASRIMSRICNSSTDCSPSCRTSRSTRSFSRTRVLRPSKPR